MNTPILRRTHEHVTSTYEDVIDKIEELASTLAGEAEKAGADVQAELAALPEQLERARRAVVAAVEPHRPPKQYRPYVRLGVLAVILAAAIAIIVGRRRAAHTDASSPEQAIGAVVETAL